MIRRIVVGLLGVAFLVAGLSIAQEPAGDDPPVRLKKKVRPEAADKAKEEPPKPAEPPKEEPKEKPDKEKGAKEGDQPAEPEQPEMDQAEVLNRVGKNMRTSEDHLANRELNDGTRQVQDDILKDLDSLINQVKNGGGGADQNQEQNQNEQQQQNGENQQGGKQKQGGQVKMGMGRKKGGLKGQQQARAGQGQKQGGQQPGGQAQQQANAGQKPNQGQKPSQQQGGNQGGGGGQSQPGESTKLAEMYKDVWGHLPETMRAEMNAYSREQFMAKYNDLIKQYYSTVAEKSRRKE